MEAAFNIQIASEENLDALVQVAAAFRDQLERSTPTKEELRKAIGHLLKDEATEFIVAVGGNGQCLGYVQQRYRYSAWLLASEAYLEDLFVMPGARRCGLGVRLLEFALDRATAKGCRLIGLNTNERNEAAVALYQGAGFSCERTHWQEGRQVWFGKELAVG